MVTSDTEGSQGAEMSAVSFTNVQGEADCHANKAEPWFLFLGR